MAAKGSVLKQEIIEKILATFPDSFPYNDGKEVRINGVEEGQEIQIKIALTAVKIPVEGGSSPNQTSKKDSVIEPAATEKIPDEPTEEEKARLAMLLEKLGI